ncbi:MAG: radical SAM family heme chaperone HemW [Planctomycetota bacterium]|nr:radical SAM family heme chaperone HemW [Planctomycetota bacterium]
MEAKSTNRELSTGMADPLQHDPESLSPGLYVHVPFCRSRCTYCDFHVESLRLPIVREYSRALIREIELTAETGFKPNTIFIGGGTPSALDAKCWDDLLAALARNFGSGIREWTIEANPESIDERKLEVALSHGVDRISTGAQTFDEKGLSLLGRRHDASRVMEVHRMMASVGVPRTSLDLIVGWPGQDLNSVSSDLAAVEEIDPDHVSLYHLSYEQGTWLHRMRSRGAIDPLQEEQCIEASRFFLEGLSRQGYQRYEVSNLFKRGGASLHNLNYWQRGTYLGVGSGAASFLAGDRWKNRPDVSAYIRSPGRPERVEEETPDRLTAAVESIMLKLRLVEGLDLARWRSEGGYPLEQICHGSLRQFAQRGLLVHEGDRLRITDSGFEILDSILIALIEDLEGASDDSANQPRGRSDDRSSNLAPTGLDQG